MCKAGIIGATGYAGVELVRLLLGHPQIRGLSLSSVSFQGKALREIYPAFQAVTEDMLVDEDTVIAKSDVVFASLPHGFSEKLAVKCAAAGKALIDLGADFRLEQEADYTQWYGLPYTQPALHEAAVYGLPELFREAVKGSRVIANPGCYPTSIALALAPLLGQGLVDTDSIIIDAKSGATGAGRGLTQSTHFPDCNENFAPYKVAQHRHTPEIEQTLTKLAGRAVTVTFVPHLLPVNRGILSTIYAKLQAGIAMEHLQTLYREFYQKEPFVRVLAAGETACIRSVKYSNYCDVSLHLDNRTGRVIVVSAIDNMVKGAAGQAIQNMNLLLGYDETAGLMLVPPSF